MVRVAGIRKAYRSTGKSEIAVQDVSLEIVAGEFYTLLGPSGSGKTTTLRCIAGLEDIDQGVIQIDGVTVSAVGTKVPPHARGLGMVFQSYAVWPHMTVFDNVAFPLRMQSHGKLNPTALRKRVMDTLDLVSLGHLAERPAPALSGGQQQRVALARALVGQPKMLLLDEPLSNLDTQLRSQMRMELRRLTRELAITSLYVTHDQVEALTMSDRVGVMHDGRLVQEGTSVEIYRHPQTAFVAKFLGTANLIRGTVSATDDSDGNLIVDTPLGSIRCLSGSFAAGTSVDIVVRPENLRLARDQADIEFNLINATVTETMFVGSYTHCELEVNGVHLTAHVQSHEELTIGKSRQFRFRPSWASLVPVA